MCCFADAGSVAGRAGVPMEVMGLMLGEFVDDYTIVVSVSDPGVDLHARGLSFRVPLTPALSLYSVRTCLRCHRAGLG